MQFRKIRDPRDLRSLAKGDAVLLASGRGDPVPAVFVGLGAENVRGPRTAEVLTRNKVRETLALRSVPADAIIAAGDESLQEKAERVSELVRIERESESTRRIGEVVASIVETLFEDEGYSVPLDSGRSSR